MNHNHSVARLLAALWLFGSCSVVIAQAFPSRPVTIVIPFPPGGISDGSTRVIAAKATIELGQPILVESRPGAGGQIAADVVKTSKPDGHSLFLANIGSHGINESLYSKLSYNPTRDFEPVTNLFSSSTLVVVPAASPAKNMNELIELARTKADKASYASQSIGSGGHLSGELVKARNKLDLLHVPYKGSAPGLTDLVAGRVDFMFDPIITALPFVKDGKLRALAITSTRRSALAPDVPTLAEAGHAGYEVNPWFGLAAPAGTPQPIIERLYQAFSKAAKDPEVVKRLADQGIETLGTTPAEFAAFIKAETARWTEVVKMSGAKAD